jgi:hypothetical protein
MTGTPQRHEEEGSPAATPGQDDLAQQIESAPAEALRQAVDDVVHKLEAVATRLAQSGNGQTSGEVTVSPEYMRAYVEEARREAVAHIDSLHDQIDSMGVALPGDARADAVERARVAAAQSLIEVNDRLGVKSTPEVYEVAGVDPTAARPTKPGLFRRLARAVRGS